MPTVRQIEKKGREFKKYLVHKGRYSSSNTKHSLASVWLEQAPEVRALYYPWNPFWNAKRLHGDIHRRVLHTQVREEALMFVNPERDFRDVVRGNSLKLIDRRYKTLTGTHVPRLFTLRYNTRTQPFMESRGEAAIQGMPVDWDKFRGFIVSDKPTVFLISVRPYTTRAHSSHAVACVHYRDTMYFFNAWGNDALDTDKGVIEKLKMKMKGKTNVMVYTGPNLQSDNYFGVCVGYSANFALELILLIRRGRVGTIKTETKYNEWIYGVLQKRGICFGGKCVDCIDFKTQMAKDLTKNTTPNVMNLNNSQFREYAKVVSGMPKTKAAFKKKKESNLVSMLSPSSVLKTDVIKKRFGFTRTPGDDVMRLIMNRGLADVTTKPKGSQLLRSMYKKRFPSSKPTYIEKLKFWMTNITPPRKRDFLNKISDPMEFTKMYPACAS